MRPLFYILAAFVAFAANSAFAHDYRLAEIEIGHPWTRATPPSARVGGGYLTLTNHGGTADRLVGGSSPAAGRVEIHTMEVTDGVMKMRPVADGVEVPAGETVELAPGGFHLMLMELKEPIADGDRVPVTLEFEHAGTVEVELAAGPAGSPGTGHGDHGEAGDQGGAEGHGGHGGHEGTD